MVGAGGGTVVEPPLGAVALPPVAATVVLGEGLSDRIRGRVPLNLSTLLQQGAAYAVVHGDGGAGEGVEAAPAAHGAEERPAAAATERHRLCVLCALITSLKRTLFHFSTFFVDNPSRSMSTLFARIPIPRKDSWVKASGF